MQFVDHKNPYCFVFLNDLVISVFVFYISTFLFIHNYAWSKKYTEFWNNLWIENLDFGEQLSLFAYHHDVPSLYDFLSLEIHKRYYLKAGCSFSYNVS